MSNYHFVPSLFTENTFFSSYSFGLGKMSFLPSIHLIAPRVHRFWKKLDFLSFSSPLHVSTLIGLQDQIKLVPINLQNRPAWYKEKVYPENKAPALERNGKIIGESVDMIKYVDSNFEGPSLFPNDPHKVKFGEELISHVGTFTEALYTAFKAYDTVKQAGNSFYTSYGKKSTPHSAVMEPKIQKTRTERLLQDDQGRIKITEEKCSIKVNIH